MDINRMTNKLIAAIASLILKELWTPRAVIIVTSIVSATVITFMFGARRIRLGKARCASRQLNVADFIKSASPWARVAVAIRSNQNGPSIQNVYRG